MYKLTKSVQDKSSWCMMSVDNVILVEENVSRVSEGKFKRDIG